MQETVIWDFLPHCWGSTGLLGVRFFPAVRGQYFKTSSEKFYATIFSFSTVMYDLHNTFPVLHSLVSELVKHKKKETCFEIKRDYMNLVSTISKGISVT